MNNKDTIRQWWIYRITNPVGGVYIGKSCNIKSRISAYKNLTKACMGQPLIYNSLLKYGSDNHKFDLIDSFYSDSEYSYGKEMFWIRSYMSNRGKWPNMGGLNLTDGGEFALGYKQSDELKKKRSEMRMGLKMSDEARRNMSLARTGKPSPLRGYKHTEATKLKASLAHMGIPSKNKGKKIWSEEDKKRIGQSKIGNKYMLGKNHTKENCNKLRDYGFNRCGKMIYQYDMNGNLIAEYRGIRMATRITGICRKTIQNSANGFDTPRTKFIFKYNKS